MNTYMTPDHPDAFLDWPTHASRSDLTQLCPRCQGHGGWNLLLDQYRLPLTAGGARYADTAENRHLFCHFRAMCDHCTGWGWIPESETCPGHEWLYVANVGRCLNQYQCRHCSRVQQVDSSD